MTFNTKCNRHLKIGGICIKCNSSGTEIFKDFSYLQSFTMSNVWDNEYDKVWDE